MPAPAPARQSSSFERPLDGLERQFWHLRSLAPVNTVAIVTARGWVGEDALRDRLERLEARHPLLRVHLAEPGGHPRFVARGTPSVPLRVAKPEGEAWEPEVERELATPFLEEGPLVRVVALPREGRSTLLVTFDHVVADATGALDLALDLLRDPGRGGATMERLEPLPLGALLGPSKGSLASRLALLRENASAARFLLRHKPSFPPEQVVAPEQRRSKVLALPSSEAETSRLVEACRRHDTTVHGALAAAWLQALHREVGEDGPYTLNTAVNLRPHLPRTPPPGVFGLYAAARNTFHRVDRGTSFWDLARDARRAVAHAVEGPALLGYLRNLEASVPQDRDAARTARMVEAFDRWFPPRIALTNLGRLDPASAQAAGVEGFTFAPSLAAAGCAVLVAASTVGGRLQQTLVYPTPLVGPARAARLASYATAALREALP